MSDETLDILLGLPSSVKIRLLTFRPKPDFKVAVQKFRAQFQADVQVRVHNSEIHDRAIVIDDLHFYALGASIKGLGEKLSLINKLEDSVAINTLRKALKDVWDASNPLS